MVASVFNSLTMRKMHNVKISIDNKHSKMSKDVENAKRCLLALNLSSRSRNARNKLP